MAGISRVSAAGKAIESLIISVEFKYINPSGRSALPYGNDPAHSGSDQYLGLVHRAGNSCAASKGSEITGPLLDPSDPVSCEESPEVEKSDGPTAGRGAVTQPSRSTGETS